MAVIEKSIDINVPVNTVYNQWTQFEEFPAFMNGVREVKQLDDRRMHWRAEVAGKEEEWDAEIYEQQPDKRIAWRSTSGVPNGGLVTFEPIGTMACRVNLRMEYEPQGLLENVGSALGFDSLQVQGDLERFKAFIEARGEETGAWRGQIHERSASETSATPNSL